MGRPPAYLFVVRHGIRLDAADKQWHLSSPTPYDPPLTYAGWQQAKSLGARIASILRDRVNEDEAAARQTANTSAPTKRKRYKVVIHSSPFLRCIQTSIAISAGLAQDSTPFGPTTAVPPRPPRTPSPGTTTSHIRPTINTDVTRDGCTPVPGPDKVPIRKSVLRLDAFLGEWLNPGYFELITPPPESSFLLGTARSELLRREDYASYPTFSSHAHSSSQGQLWSPGSRPSPSTLLNDGISDGFTSSSSLSSSLPRSPSVSSYSSQASQTSQTPLPQRLSSPPVEPLGYVAPVPNYAVNGNHTIPLGYVSHAKDACVQIDYGWDSMRPPLCWGDGGSFPEEWTSMHRRFRAGIQNLVDWYSAAENPTELTTKVHAYNGRGSNGNQDWDDVETEAVVILVSHGAGCNALIGAITHQPVLMDVAMASLTMAVRKSKMPESERSDAPLATTHRRPGSPEKTSKDSIPVHQLYDLKLFANTEHIRSPAPTPTSSRSPSVASIINGTRGRYSNSFSSALNNFSFNDASGSRAASANAALSSLRRGSNPSVNNRLAFNLNSQGGGITVGSGVTSFAATKPSSLGRKPSIGLWSPTSTQFEDDDDEEDMLLNFSHEKTTPTPANIAPPVQPLTVSPVQGDREMTVADIIIKGPADGLVPSDAEAPRFLKPHRDPPQLGEGPGGLWGGSPRPTDDADRLRDTTCTKRRWTVTDRSQ